MIISSVAKLVFCGAMLFALIQCGEGKSAQNGSTRADRRVGALLQRIAYVSDRNGNAVLFDVEAGKVTVQSKKAVLAGRPDLATDLGASLTNCDTESLYCFNSGLVIAVPKSNPFPPEWQVSGISCRTLPRARNSPPEVTSAECRFGSNRATLFDFSSKRGVIRYMNECPGCRVEVLELVGDIGLFARPE